MLSSLVGVFSNDMAVDLGTANTLVYVPNKGIVLDEPSIVAFTHRDGARKVLAVGQEAKSMLGRTPEDIETIQPMRDGVIADFVAAEEMIKHFIRRIHKRSSFASPKIMICIPAGATPVERRAVHEAALAAGARRVFLIEEPVAAAIGAGLPVSQPKGAMVVDIGGGTTDIAIITMGSVFYSSSLRVAGNAFDDAIINYIRHKHNLLIGSASAESIKLEAGTAIAKANGSAVEVHIKGRDLRRHIPNEVKMGQGDIADALDQPIEAIADSVKLALERIPPELAADIYSDGIVLTGGGALLPRIDVKLARRTGVKFKIPEDPLRCVAVGTGLALEQLDELKDLLAQVQ
jgi:rod shape-determining protein MreB